MTRDWPRRRIPRRLGPLTLRPGTCRHGSLDAGVCDIPLVVLAGTAPGPILYVQAVQHGLELNGADVMRRLLEGLKPRRLRGTLVLVPMANPLAARVHMQAFPYPDNPRHRGLNDMNRRWFAKPAGTNFPDRLVAALAPLVAQADAALDLHCHELLYPASALTDMRIRRCAELALAMGFPFVHASGESTEGMFGRYCRKVLGKPAVTVEMPPLRRVHHPSSALGLRGVLNAMRQMGMLEGALERPAETAILGLKGQRGAGVVAEAEGFMTRYVESGSKVRQGALVATIREPRTFRVAQRIRAPFDGYVNTLGRVPIAWGDPEQDYVNLGERVAGFVQPARIVRFAGLAGG